MPAALFWLTGVAFFAIQLGTLLFLLQRRRRAAGDAWPAGAVEVVWTLVPAALVAALALMATGLTQGSWTRVRAGGEPLAARDGAPLRAVPALPPAPSEAR